MDECLNELKFLESQLNLDQKEDLTKWCKIKLEKYDRLSESGNMEGANTILQDLESKIKDFISDLPTELFIKIADIYINKRKELVFILTEIY